MTSDDRGLLRRTRALLEEATVTYRGTPHERVLRRTAERLDAPLRVAIAGRVKAGKSTLLNALVGERVAATDASECTRVVTWYSDGVAYRAWAHPREGAPVQVPFRREGGETTVDLDGHDPADLTRLRIEFPSRRLQRLTLIDTPGIASLSLEVSQRTHDLVQADDEDGADAVIYLLRHLHTSDVHFLEAFHDEVYAGTAPANAIGVLSRADEVGAGRTDAVDVARGIARRYRRDPRVRALVQTVVPVAGLLGQSAATLTEQEYAQLSALARAPETAALLLSVDRLLAPDAPAPVSEDIRRALVDRYGLFGVRLAVALIVTDVAPTATALADELLARSGMPDLQAVLLSQFTDRRRVIKAHQALRAVQEALADDPRSGSSRLQASIEEILAGAHEFEELRVLNDLRTGEIEVPDDRREEMEVLLGADGGGVRARLGLPDDASVEDARARLLEELTRWQQLSENPVAAQPVRRAAAVLRRTCEGLLHDPEFRTLVG